MAEYNIIPIDNTDTNQTFQVVLGGNEYNFSLRYNNRMERWILGISDKDNNVIFSGLSLVLGINYLTLINDARLPQGNLFMWDFTNQFAEPTLTSLGVTCKMIYTV